MTQTDIRGFYPRAVASRLARVPPWVLLQWDKKGIVVPTIRLTDERKRIIDGYDFEGLVYLRLVRMLRGEQKKPFPMRKIVTAVKFLSTLGPPGPPWEDYRIYTDGPDIYVEPKGTAYPTISATKGSMAWTELFGKEFEQFRSRSDTLLIPFPFAPWVEINPKVRNGMPVIIGTGIETAMIHRLIQQGYRPFEIVKDYPYVSREQVIHGDRFEKCLDWVGSTPPFMAV